MCMQKTRAYGHGRVGVIGFGGDDVETWAWSIELWWMRGWRLLPALSNCVCVMYKQDAFKW